MQLPPNEGSGTNGRARMVRSATRRLGRSPCGSLSDDDGCSASRSAAQDSAKRILANTERVPGSSSPSFGGVASGHICSCHTHTPSQSPPHAWRSFCSRSSLSSSGTLSGTPTSEGPSFWILTAPSGAPFGLVMCLAEVTETLAWPEEKVRCHACAMPCTMPCTTPCTMPYTMVQRTLPAARISE